MYTVHVGEPPFYTAACITLQYAHTWAYLHKLLQQSHTDRKQMSLKQVHKFQRMCK